MLILEEFEILSIIFSYFPSINLLNYSHLKELC